LVHNQGCHLIIVAVAIDHLRFSPK